MPPFRLITLDPAHFHAALVQKEMYPEVSDRVTVYAPLGPDLIEHLHRVARFNLRPQAPTSWQLDVHASPDFLARMLAERPGNIVMLSGRNRGKIALIRASIDAGLHVLADKPWIIRPEDLPSLEAALEAARRNGVIAYDIMTERYEITSILQRELVNDAGVFGEIVQGSEREPGVTMESVHQILKMVAGVPNLRPAWFFDLEQQGGSLADVGTHLVDLAQWTLFPDDALDYRRDVQVTDTSRWPTRISAAQFRQVAGHAGPALDYSCNTRVHYTLRGVHIQLDVLWNWEAPAGCGDIYNAVFRGTRSSVEVRQGKNEDYRPELYVVLDPALRPALQEKVTALGRRYPGIGTEDRGGEVRITIPDLYRVGHEAHFAQVTRRFFEYLQRPEGFPAWEYPNMLAKYCVSSGAGMRQPCGDQ